MKALTRPTIQQRVARITLCVVTALGAITCTDSVEPANPGNLETAVSPAPAARGKKPPPCASEAACGKIAFVSARDGNPEIYSINPDRTGLTRLTNDAAFDDEPAWSPDGNRIAFASDRSGSYEIYVMNADGSNIVRLTFAASYSSNPSWSPDGSKIAYTGFNDGSANLWVVSPYPDSGGPTPLFSTPFRETHPSWSPDGTRLALASDWNLPDFVEDIFLINADGSGATALTGDIFDQVDYLRPSWSPDGTKIAVAIQEAAGNFTYTTRIGVMSADGSGLTPLISAAMFAKTSWSADGQLIAFTSPSGKTGTQNVAWVKADGSGSGIIVTNGWNADWQR